MVEPYFHKNLLDESPEFDYFLIREPFNHTYNPAKVFKHNIIADK
jgi:hypothetical protein